MVERLIRTGVSQLSSKTAKCQQLEIECTRLEENCRYTAAGLYDWSKSARCISNVLLVVPIVCGAFASSEILFGFFGEKSELLIAISALLAGLFPAIFKALDLDNNTKQILSSAAEFTNLRDRFRQLGKIKPTETFDELYQSFETLVEKLEDVRRLSPPLPNKHFKSARKSIEAGNYTNEPDIS